MYSFCYLLIKRPDEIVLDSTKKLQDVLAEFCGTRPPYMNNPDGVSYLNYTLWNSIFEFTYTGHSFCQSKLCFYLYSNNLDSLSQYFYKVVGQTDLDLIGNYTWFA